MICVSAVFVGESVGTAGARNEKRCAPERRTERGEEWEMGRVRGKAGKPSD